MTDPSQSGGPTDGPPPIFPPPAGYPPPPPGYQPYPPAYVDPSAPYGRHPITGEPFSDKSKVIAGLLQLLGLFGLVGIGRIYLGQTGLGVAQLIVGLVTCGIGAFIWGIIDAVLILTDRVRDPFGRPLRDGT
ncbi:MULTISPECIES: NINE protein [unclassified Mycolicibacterium]|uniref:NINE protein n=1 Tax=unclassified Mycolicibacterium TaxID=2636767 RepID=UPI0012DE7AF6|nr:MULTISPECIES: NINE protein [unclassified Mycolicibacterium]MUL84626.1 TM2 domain-containing protein [Mycolicibacterium sp. CBMA 329]MUL88401.1 TM2 domain-containing protein [Mycolicibacterium sp. CBMA 331]MUM02939.1 TM2 domain-containing protein [Mycolicibacterium sp. CBMA 334]MUM25088.1 TM2 domain-containing protein [Mycolicibacterium sp. CBMA 295]MUM40048.1 TM2 domain-containing protein [Mycolicibacterium sp. CBMA 247]